MTFQHVSKAGRKDHNFYPTPQDLIDPVKALIGAEAIWEPACGDGRISEALRDQGNHVWSTDVHAHGYSSQDDVRSFYDYTSLPSFFYEYDHVSIVTNPPHSREHADRFVRHALELATKTDKRVDVFLLLRHAWDTAKTRIDLCDRIDCKLTMCWRPKWFEGDSKKTPMHSYAWFYWENGGQGEGKNVYIDQNWNKVKP